MGDTFNSLIKEPWVGVRFLMKIQGIGQVFLDGEIPKKQNGDNWAALSSNGPSAYGFKENILDVSSGGLQDIGQQISRSDGHTSPGQITITLMDNRAGYLRELFAKDSPDTNTAQLSDTAALTHDTTGSGTVVTCDSAITGWATSGYAYIGRETIYYPVISGSDFGTGGNKCNRDVYSIGHCDVNYTPNANGNKAPRIITSKPTVWHGRYVQLYCFLVDRQGRALGDDLSTMAREVFRGIMQGPALPDQSYSRYKINARSIDSALHTSVGLEPVEGELIRVIGTKAENSAGNQYDYNGSKDWVKQYYLTDSTRYVHLTLRYGNPVTASHTFKLDVLDGLVGVGGAWFVGTLQLYDIFSGSLTDQIQAEGGEWAKVNIKIWNGSGTNKKWKVSIGTTDANHNSDGATALTWAIDWDEEGSIGQLLGMSGQYGPTAPGGLTFSVSYQKGEEYIAGIIGSKDTVIPFFYKNTFGLGGETPSAPGWVRIGKEIIKYTSIEASASSALQGMHALVGCTRGVGGTKAETHTIQYNADGMSANELVDVKFIQYFGGSDGKGVSFFDIILQLAISTGSGHHDSGTIGGTAYNYDTLGQYVGPAIPPGHFDTASFEYAKSTLLDHEHHVTWWFDKPQQLMEVASKWLKPLGMFLTGRTTDDGDYKIGIVETLPPLQANYTQQLLQANIDATAPANWTAQDQIVNEVVVKYIWDVAEGKPTESYVCVRDTDSITDYGVKGRLEWELQGYQWDYQTAMQQTHTWAATVFARFGRPFDLIEIEVDRSGWLVRPGDSILLTMAGPPNTDDGSRVYNARVARVLGVSYRYHSPNGQPGARLTVIIENVQRWASYVPSASVTAVSGDTLTLSVNDFTEAVTGDKDVNHFDVGDYVQIFNKGDMDHIDLRHIVSKSNNDIELNSALSNVTFNASKTKVTGQVWDQSSLQTTQRNHAYLSTLTDLGAGLDTTAFKYS